MNNPIDYRQEASSALSATINTLWIGAAMLAGLQLPLANWPETAVPSYSVDRQGSSYSPLSGNLAPNSITNIEFAQRVARLYANLAEGQEPLGREFEEIWDAHADDLYES